MGAKNDLLYKENNEKHSKRKKSKLWDIIIPFGISILFIIFMVWFWYKGRLTLKSSSIILIFGFLIFFNAFSTLNYLQYKMISPLRIFDWGILSPEPNLLSLTKIKFSNVDKIIIDRYFKFTGTFMVIHKRDGSRIGINRLDEDDVDIIHKILEKKGIVVENKL